MHESSYNQVLRIVKFIERTQNGSCQKLGAEREWQVIGFFLRFVFYFTLFYGELLFNEHKVLIKEMDIQYECTYFTELYT